MATFQKKSSKSLKSTPLSEDFFYNLGTQTEKGIKKVEALQRSDYEDVLDLQVMNGEISEGQRLSTLILMKEEELSSLSRGSGPATYDRESNKLELELGSLREQLGNAAASAGAKGVAARFQIMKAEWDAEDIKIGENLENANSAVAIGLIDITEYNKRINAIRDEAVTNIKERYNDDRLVAYSALEGKQDDAGKVLNSITEKITRLETDTSGVKITDGFDWLDNASFQFDKPGRGSVTISIPSTGQSTKMLSNELKDKFVMLMNYDDTTQSATIKPVLFSSISKKFGDSKNDIQDVPNPYNPKVSVYATPVEIRAVKNNMGKWVGAGEGDLNNELKLFLPVTKRDGSIELLSFDEYKKSSGLTKYLETSDEWDRERIAPEVARLKDNEVYVTKYSHKFFINKPEFGGLVPITSPKMASSFGLSISAIEKNKQAIEVPEIFPQNNSTQQSVANKDFSGPINPATPTAAPFEKAVLPIQPTRQDIKSSMMQQKRGSKNAWSYL